ncbi:EF-P lysine aminoacylase EpmA [Gallaecimonas xiamenensis]|uniref:Lysyl-tRNA synthetase-like protein GenX n=1 Tax=Gallaecimonas xiamenensis 3-C-1 TaxID=745411 RepID=K2K6F8_9GAMM|nr:EF-P lysine aminoacylase EpmA [Gallaecimonas xiamenensis]EKE73020.1 lysyl-tRNA synthetase-like protein GenX [Gallaecimonas xiamenensis 3-C-1]
MIDNHWQPQCSLDALKRRARLFADIRAFFAARQVLEVDTPVLSQGSISDPHIEVMTSTYTGPLAPEGLTLYLQTSPEFAMKRLLAAGSGCIYQLGKVFRNEEAGRRHNSEFCMLEWYRLGFDHHQLMDEIRDLLVAVAGLDAASIEKVSYLEAFQRTLGINPHTASLEQLQALAQQHAHYGQTETDRDTLLNLLVSFVIEPSLGLAGPSFLYDYPASQAALARTTKDAQGHAVACRFELFIKGVELANGYFELTDGAEQRRRLLADGESRRALGRPYNNPDLRLADALEAGLPDCAGVALGVDRLLMVILGAKDISQVMPFSLARA